MSGGPACNCPERKRPMLLRDWEILTYKCNYSAFNGYHYTPSDYSALKCNACGRVWRTKAPYVELFLTAKVRKNLSIGG